jgi:FtsH-binding integral membrane protein
MQENLTEKQSLSIIEEMINRAKNQFSEDGSLYLLWGWVILFCSLGHFVLQVVVEYNRPWQIWSVTWVVAVYMLIFLRRKNRTRKVKTYTEELLSYVWLAFVIMMALTFFLLQKFVPQFWLYNFMFILLCYGMPTFLSGIILQFRPLIIGGVVCWVLSAASGFVHFSYHPLFVSAAVVVAWIIPGFILRERFKRMN